MESMENKTVPPTVPLFYMKGAWSNDRGCVLVSLRNPADIKSVPTTVPSFPGIDCHDGGGAFRDGGRPTLKLPQLGLK